MKIRLKIGVAQTMSPAMAGMVIKRVNRIPNDRVSFMPARFPSATCLLREGNTAWATETVKIPWGNSNSRWA